MNQIDHKPLTDAELREPYVYPVGTILPVPVPTDTEGVWKRMDGCENLHPGSGVDYRHYLTGTPYFERVA